MTDTGKRGEIHLGDLVRALGSLGWQTDAEAQAIAACLGFGLRATGPAPRPPTEIYDRQRYRARAPAPAQPPGRRPVLVPPTPEPPPTLPAHALPSRLAPLTERAPAAPVGSEWLDEDDQFYSVESELVVARQTLFPERTSRHIISAALATLRAGREIDVSGLIAAICRREVIAGLPRRSESTLDLGCQLLLDYSATMVPFWEDLTGLTGQITEVVGAANTRVFSFDTRPTDAMCWTPRGEQEPWRAEGCPVLAATDFGIQGQYGRAELSPAWPDLVELCARAGSPLVIVVPWPEERWPMDIGSYPELVHWSPHTSAAMIKGKVGLGHRVG